MDLQSIYSPAQFGNFFECAAKNEMKRLFADWKSWGINGFGTEFSPVNVVDPFGSDPLYRWAREKPLEEWKRKCNLLLAAQEAGLSTTLCNANNAVYIDQLKPALAAAAPKGEYGVIGPNLCPSQAEAEEIILRNWCNLLGLLKKSGVRLDYVLAFFRDWGGCECEKCQPWVKKVISYWEKDLSAILLSFFPQAKVQFCTWWVKADEMPFIQEFLARKPKWVDGLNLSLGYQTDIPQVEIPPSYRKTIFLHISYSSGHTDKYGVKGAVVAPSRLDLIFKNLAKRPDIAGYQAYSEGIFDDLNKFLVGYLGPNPLLDTRQLVANYCRQYFGTNDQDTEKMVTAIYQLEVVEKEPAGGEQTHDILAKIGDTYSLAGNWRYELLRIRAKVAELEHRIGNKEQWQTDTDNLDAVAKVKHLAAIEQIVEERRETLEYLERYVYRVGTQCHLLDIDVEYRPWREWKDGLKLQGEKIGNDKFLA